MIEINRKKMRPDKETGDFPDGSMPYHWWLGLDDVLYQVSYDKESNRTLGDPLKGAKPKKPAVPEVAEKITADVEADLKSERAQQGNTAENNLQFDRMKDHAATPTGRSVDGAERGNSLNVVQSLMSAHHATTGEYPLSAELTKMIELLAHGADVLIDANTASTKKPRW